MSGQFFISLLCLAALLSAQPAFGQAVSATRTLSFGKFVARSGGTITVQPSGARSAGGSVLLISTGPGASASFQVSDGDPANADKSFIISLPADGSVTLSGPSGSMAVDSFTSDPSETGALSAGSQAIQVGATLKVGPDQPAGSYSGSFQVLINYQ
jgi:hypothetical protein